MKITKCPPMYAEGYRPQSMIGIPVHQNSGNPAIEQQSIIDVLEALGTTGSYTRHEAYGRDGKKNV